MTRSSFVRGERARDFLGRGADVDEQRTAVGHQRRRRRADRPLLGGCHEAACGIGEVLDARRHDRAAMHAGEGAALAQVVEILADGLRRDLEAARQIVDRHPAERAGQLHDFGLPPGNGHCSDKYPCAAALKTGNRAVGRTTLQLRAVKD